MEYDERIQTGLIWLGTENSDAMLWTG